MPVDIRKDVLTQSATQYLSDITGYCPIHLLHKCQGLFLSLDEDQWQFITFGFATKMMVYILAKAVLVSDISVE